MPDAMNIIMNQINPEGTITPDIQSNMEMYAAIVQQLTADEIVGDANINGTPIFIVAVPAGHKLILIDLSLNTKVAASTVVTVQSNIAGVGGVETWLVVADAAGPGPLQYYPRGPVVAYIDNSIGVAPVYLVIYAPQTRAGLATNNAVTQFWSGTIRYIII